MRNLVLVLLVAALMPMRAAEPMPVIFDTDITGDVDDVLALAMLHALADRQECRIFAVTISKIDPLTAPFVDAMNTLYGRGELPIGATRKAQVRKSKYLHLVTQRDGDQWRYPHDVESADAVPDAVTVLRQTLVTAPDHAVRLITVGVANNVADLLDSQADAISPLSGVDLVKQKVALISIMAGAFHPVDGNAHFLEANVKNGIDAMQRFADRCPDDVPVIWSEYGIGVAVAYPRTSIAHDFSYLEPHLVREAYLAYCGPNHDRPSWDLTSVLYAVRPDDGYFGLSDNGRVSVAADGFTTFTPAANGRDRYLTMTTEQRVRVVEVLRALAAQPPLALGQR